MRASWGASDMVACLIFGKKNSPEGLFGSLKLINWFKIYNYMSEYWKLIHGYENYMISNLGRVKSLNGYGNTGKEILLSPNKNRCGYIYYRIGKDGKQFFFTAHFLVASNFIPNPDNHNCINHKDENKLNNSIENLMWCDQKTNIDYSISKPVLDNTSGKIYPSIRDASRDTSTSVGKITRDCKGHTKNLIRFTYVSIS